MSEDRAASPMEASKSPSSESVKEKKRKRAKEEVLEDEKLEIDVSAPEPPSKKAKRAEKKKQKEQRSKKKETATDEAPKPEAASAKTEEGATSDLPKRSDYGIWIGNLLWTATKDSLRTFLKDQGGIPGTDIVRLHMPAPKEKDSKAQNKGFAYVDFTSQAVLEVALGLSEKLMGGRKVLIKNAKSFEGRPEKAKTTGALEAKRAGAKSPTQRVFVGNLGFDVTKEDLEEHFGKAGEVEDVHMATFQDSGKCKGFAWVRFREVEGAEAAVRGFVYVKADDENEDENGDAEESEDDVDEGDKKEKAKKAKPRRHKMHINRLQGRDLRCEFAEDAQTRYKKRFGKATNAESAPDRRAFRPQQAPSGEEAVDQTLHHLTPEAAPARSERPPKPQHRKPDADQRREQRRKKHMDARLTAPGKALANAQRATGAIVAGAGKKVTFD